MNQEVRTSPKKARKPQSRSLPLRAAILDVAAEYERMSVRQLFYQLVSRGAIEKTEQAYKRVCDMSVQLRLDGSLPYTKIADGHRSRRVAYMLSSLADAIEDTALSYRRNMWITQPAAVEVWCEKDALTGVIQPICEEYGVPYVATRGFPSKTLLYESAREMIGRNKPTIVYYYGDHDASGRAISQSIEPELRGHGANVEVIRDALEPYQISIYRLPTRPGKTGDSRHAKFAAEYGSQSVELDALPPNVLTSMVRFVIRRHIDVDEWLRMEQIEEQERITLQSLATIAWTPGVRYLLPEDGGIP